MAPTEAEILTSYLVQPAPLTAVTTLEQFRALFPRPLRSSPQVRSLFRDLQARRAEAVVDAVVAGIEAEARRGAAMRREVLRQRREAARAGGGADGGVGADDGEVEMERALFGSAAGAGDGGRHSLQTIIPELDGAADALEAEIRLLEEEEAALLASVKKTVGGLSDLRYGKFANSELRDQVSDGLESLQYACRDKS